MRKLENLYLSNSFAKLGADFFQEKQPDPVSSPYLVDSNPAAITTEYTPKMEVIPLILAKMSFNSSIQHDIAHLHLGILFAYISSTLNATQWSFPSSSNSIMR